jgi:hypothetical protein
MKNSSEIVLSFRGVQGKERVATKLVELALLQLQGTIASSDLERIKGQILTQFREDPYLQGKLDRLTGLLETSS